MAFSLPGFHICTTHTFSLTSGLLLTQAQLPPGDQWSQDRVGVYIPFYALLSNQDTGKPGLQGAQLSSPPCTHPTQYMCLLATLKQAMPRSLLGSCPYTHR